MPPNQRALAAAADVSQTTVSLSLRGDPSIPPATRERIRTLAARHGYRPDPAVAGLMARIRGGRSSKAGGCIALLVDSPDRVAWLDNDIFRLQYEGMRTRARVLGFRVEAFYLRASGMNAARLDRILRNRGIRGLVLAGPKRGPVDLSDLSWDDYASATISYTWDSPAMDRVSSHHRHNMDETLRRLAEHGYRRIGVSLNPNAASAVDRNWLAGALVWNQHTTPRNRVPVFSADPTPEGFVAFSAWLRRHRPDALVSLDGREQAWLHKLGLQTPRDLGHACVNRTEGSFIAGVEEDHAMIGSTVIELLVAQMQRNEYGLPARPRLTLINGEWREGDTLRSTLSPA